MIMQILALDDSFVRQNQYLGYGGICVSDEKVKSLVKAIIDVKKRHQIPRDVELKWSPERGHFLRTNFKGVRSDLYRDVINVLSEHNVRVIVSVHSLSECYGVRLHDWTTERAALWAAKQQLQFLAERFENNVLVDHDDNGIIISDRYGSRVGEEDLISDFNFTMIVGTAYSNFHRIILPPMMGDSKHLHLIQAADIVTGIVVATLGNSHFGIELFEDVAQLFVTNPTSEAIAYASSFSHAVMGYGLKLFPKAFSPEGITHLSSLDEKFIVTHNGLKQKYTS